MRPRLLRPPDLRSGSVSAGSGRLLVTSAKSCPVWNRRPAEVGRYWTMGTALRPLEEVDAVALGERDVGLLPVGPAAVMATHATHLAELLRGADLQHPDLEQRPHRVPDLDLVGAGMDPEHDLVAGLADERPLLGDHRALHDLDEVHPASPSRAAIASSAGRVTTKVACPSTS